MPATLADIQKKYGGAVYPLYKDESLEPYMNNSNGGYLGVVLYDGDKDKVRCDECGEWFTTLNSHHLRKHKLDVRRYKNKYGILLKSAMQSKKMSGQQSSGAMNRHKIHTGAKDLLKKHAHDKRRFKKKNVGDKIGHKNKYGLCDAQIAARLIIARDMAGRKNVEELTTSDLYKFDRKLIMTISSRFGNFKKAAKYLKIKFLNGKRYEESTLITHLRHFVLKHKRIPKWGDFELKENNEYGVGVGVFIEYFGSWRRAKMMAGVSKLFFEVNGRKATGKEESNNYLKEDLINELKRFTEENGRPPTAIDFEKDPSYPSVPTYYKYFGSWNQAKVMAGLDQLLEEVKNK